MQLVFNALPHFHGYFTTLPPSIMKPQQLWSGKQVLSTVLLNIIPDGQEKLNLTSRAKIAPKVGTRRRERRERREKREGRREKREGRTRERERRDGGREGGRDEGEKEGGKETRRRRGEGGREKGREGERRDGGREG